VPFVALIASQHVAQQQPNELRDGAAFAVGADGEGAEERRKAPVVPASYLCGTALMK
jgi:hypothetical protein